VVEQQDGDAQGIGHTLQRAEVAVIAGVGVVVEDAPNLLQGVDDHQPGVWMRRHESFDLPFQPVPDGLGFELEVEVGRRVFGDVEQAALDAGLAVFKAEVEYGFHLCGETPDGFPLRNLEAQPERQPGLPGLGGAGKDVQPGGDERLNDEWDGGQRFVHQRFGVDGAVG
jgi:hypothetical protein